MIGKPALLQISLEGKASQFTQPLSILAFVVAAFALVAAASLTCTSHALLTPHVQTLQFPAKTSAKSGQ